MATTPWLVCLLLLVGSAVNIVDSANPTLSLPNNNTLTLPEDETVDLNTVLMTCSMDDDDDPTTQAGVVYAELTGGNERSTFLIDAETCKLYLSRPLNYEDDTSFNLRITAKDLAGDSSTEETLIITVTDVNDNAPTCSDYILVKSLPESSSANTELGTLDCTDVDTGVGGDIEFVVKSGDTAEISVDNSTGKASLAKVVDFDTAAKTIFSVVVDVKDKGTPTSFTSTATVYAIITDVDDNQPVFGSASYNPTISENAAIQSTVLDLGAVTTDADEAGTDNSLLTFGFVSTPTPDWIAIDYRTGEILTTCALDRETSTTITATVFAYSGTDSGNKATVDVTVNITDVDDSKPAFAKSYYVGYVDERAAVGTTIVDSGGAALLVVATDADDSTFTYSLTSSEFDFNSTGTTIEVASVPDYETATSYLLEVVATDAGGLKATAHVQVNINPVNEDPPVFAALNTFSVNETAVLGTVLGSTEPSLSATDADSGVDGEISYSMVSPGTVPFTVDAATGNIRVAGALDHETDPTYTFDVRATDKSATSKRSADLTVTVNVLNEIDEAPTCSAVSTVVITDATSLNQVAKSITCSDPDDVGATLTYTLTLTPDDGTFQMSNNDVVMQSIPTATHYQVSVVVNDTTAASVVNFDIVTETEFNMTLVSGGAVNVSENIVQGLDNLTWGEIFPYATFGFDSGNTDGKALVYSTTGEIQLVEPYDYETTPSYTYVIRGTSTNQEATATLVVTVVDVNDNTPVFGQGLYTLTISETASTGEVATYVATDADSDTFGPLEYSIASGNTGTAFSINNTGVLSLDTALDYSTTSSYTLVLHAADGGAPKLTGSTTVLVTVIQTDKNPASVVLTPNSASIDIAEDEYIGYLVVTVQGSDADPGTVFSYSITSGNTDSDFAINSGTGEVFVARQLDRERTANYTLTLVATDQKGTATTSALFVNITDVNDNDPQFSQEVYEFNVNDQTAAATSIGALVVSDADDDTVGNGQFNVTIDTATFPSGEFVLDVLDVDTATTMDYVTQNQYRFTVQAVDQGATPRTATAVVVVNVVLPVPTPLFNPDTGSVNVTEATDPGYQVIDLDATAQGASETNGTMTYSISSITPSADFTVTSDSGHIVLINPLDYETAQSYSVTVEACYTQNCAGVKDTFTLTINVINENDNTPLFGVESVLVQVEETATVGSVVQNLGATDADVNTFNIITYNMTGDSNDFSINSTSGEIILDNALDFTVKNEYNYVVTAADDGTPSSRQSSLSLVIEILDSNTNDPVFTSGTEVSLLDSASIGDEAFHFHATDADTGAAGTIVYGQVADSSAGKFTLNTTSGLLTTASTFDAAVQASYTYQVRASDQGNPVRTALSTLTITIVSTVPNNNDPAFNTSSASSTVSRTATAGTPVYTALATDDDNGDAGVVTHRFISGNTDGYFLIDSSTGSITTATTVLDAADTYDLVVHAADAGVPQRTATMKVTVTISPARSIAPQYEYKFTVNENEGIVEVGSINVDGGRTVSGYAISTGNVGTAFSIARDAGDGNRGDLSTTGALDFETYPQYSLQIAVTTDLGTEYKYAQVDVVDTNDNPPVFATTSVTLSIIEGTPLDTVVYTFTYTDADTLPANRDNTLELVSPGGTYFRLDAATGDLIIDTVPDFDAASTLNFDVIVKDRGDPAKKDTAAVAVTLVDVSEIQDVYPSGYSTSAMLSLELPYQASNGYLVHTLTAGDCGMYTGTGATTEYITYLDSGPFEIDSSTGRITVSDASLLTPATKYERWAVCRTTETNLTVSSTVLLMRIDTFDRDTEMVVFIFEETAETVATNEVLYLGRVQVMFTDLNRFGLGDSVPTTLSDGTTAGTATYGYVVADRSVDAIENITQPKTFLPKADILGLLTTNEFGNRIGGISPASLNTLEAIVGFEPAPATTYSYTSYSDSTWGVASIAVVCAFSVLSVAVIAYWVQHFRRLSGIIEVQSAFA